MKYYYLFSILFFIQSYVCHAQNNTGSSGGTVTNANGSVSFTIGQTFFSTSENNGSVEQGIQNTYVVSNTLGVDGAVYGYSFTIYPNPTKDLFQLQLKKLPENAYYRLLDMSGKVLSEEKIKTLQTSIDLTNLKIATYILHVSSQQKTLKTVKIIKN